MSHTKKGCCPCPPEVPYGDMDCICKCGHKPTHDPQNGWVKRFYEIWNHNSDNSLGNVVPGEVKDFIRANFIPKSAVEAALGKLTEEQEGAKCKEHRKPRGVTAEDYDCSDIHIGYEECLSDLRTLLTRDDERI